LTTPTNYKKPGVPYTRSGRPIGNPKGMYWGELTRFIGPRRPGQDPWGGTEIPGLKFTGNVPQFSDYWHQMAEQPPKPISGGGASVYFEPRGLLGSVPFEGLFGSGIGFGGMMTMAEGGLIKTPTMGTPDPNQSFINKLLFGTKYIGGNMKMLKGEVPFGPGAAAKIPGAFSKTFKNFDIEFTPGSIPDLKSFVGNWNGRRITLENYFDAIKSGASWPLITEHPAQVAGGAFNSLKAYEKGLGEIIGDLHWDPFSGVVSTLNVARKFQRQGLASEFWRIASSLGGPLSHSAARSVAGESWARPVGGIIPELKHLVPPMAGGGYINSSYMSNMGMPSFKTGVNYLYDDTIAQLHQGEAVLPKDINPWNPNATNPIGGNTYYVAPVIHAAPGMDENTLANLAAQRVHDIFKKADSKSGLSRSR
ncbi:MAG: hypothetical protein ACO3UU_02265, partial [Minisyncoccia bacterium]